MADHDTERLLTAFADHLLKNRLADEKHGRYMVNWVRRFLTFPPPMPAATANECLHTYLRALEAERHEDWQVEQARMSVKAGATAAVDVKICPHPRKVHETKRPR